MQEISPVRPANKTLTMIVLVMAFIYNVVFGFLRDPAGTDNTLFAGVLAGLRKHFFNGQFIARAEQRFQILLGKVHMAGRNFYDNLIVFH